MQLKAVVPTHRVFAPVFFKSSLSFSFANCCLPAIAVAFLYLPPVAASLSIAPPIFALLSWKRNYWSAWERSLYSLTTLAALVFIPFLLYWNLLGGAGLAGS